jgi:hypothetical protein
MDFSCKEDKGQVLDSYFHWDPFWLRRSAENGCPLCLLVWKRLDVTMAEKDMDGWEFVGGRCKILEYWQVEGEEKTLPLMFHFAGIPTGNGEQKITGFKIVTINLERIKGKLAFGKPDTYSQLSIDETIPSKHPLRDSGSTWSRDSIDQLENWLRCCCEAHECKPVQDIGDASFLPERLLHVGTEDAPKLHLVEGHQLPRDTTYATLSHCWGDPNLPRPYLLLQENLHAMLQTVKAADLPKTFNEAISVIRRLGVEYIWIDSLCIIQDSKTDWQRHAAIMWKVYSHSYLNISATASLDSRLGLFRDRHPASISTIVVEVPEAHDYLDQGQYYFYDEMAFSKEVDEAPVNTRAWVVQERLLSPRIVHFCDGQLYWECQSLQASERFPAGFPERVQRSRQRDIYKASCKINVEKKDFLHAWGSLLDLYTSCNLSYGSDKLPAISALAKQFQETTSWEGEYLAGLWKNQLFDQLLWSAQDRSMRSKEYRAPSWSWASMDGPVRASFNCYSAHRNFPNNIDYSRHLVKVIDAWTESDKDQFMSVSSGRLHLRTPVWCVSLSTSNVDRTGRDYILGFSGKANYDGGEMHTDENTDYDSLSKMDLFFVPVLCWPGVSRRTGLEDGGIDRLSGLVLTAKKTLSTECRQDHAQSKQATTAFTRVGVATMNEDVSVQLLCELGNQELTEDARLTSLTKSNERLKLEEFAPSNWFLRDLPFIPRDYATYDLCIE